MVLERLRVLHLISRFTSGWFSVRLPFVFVRHGARQYVEVSALIVPLAFANDRIKARVRLSCTSRVKLPSLLNDCFIQSGRRFMHGGNSSLFPQFTCEGKLFNICSTCLSFSGNSETVWYWRASLCDAANSFCNVVLVEDVELWAFFFDLLNHCVNTTLMKSALAFFEVCTHWNTARYWRYDEKIVPRCQTYGFNGPQKENTRYMGVKEYKDT